MKDKTLNPNSNIVSLIKAGKKTVIVGIGNVLKGDDAFGPMLIENIQGKTPAVCIDAGTAPENYAGKIAKEKPQTVLIVDAVHLSRKPGDYCLLDKSQILKVGFSTHDASVHMFIEFLEKETDASIYLLGVQPKTMDFGADMTQEVKQTLTKISDLIKEVEDA